MHLCCTVVFPTYVCAHVLYPYIHPLMCVHMCCKLIFIHFCVHMCCTLIFIHFCVYMCCTLILMCPCIPAPHLCNIHLLFPHPQTGTFPYIHALTLFAHTTLFFTRRTLYQPLHTLPSLPRAHNMHIWCLSFPVKLTHIHVHALSPSMRRVRRWCHG